MRIPQRLLIAGTLLGLAGCAATPQAPQTTPEPAVTPPEHTSELPEVELSASLLYKLLVAEFAAQEGELRLSADAYLKSATETRDPRLARRATQAAVYARDTVAALTAANLWVELEPENIDARQTLAALLIRNGQTEKAAPHLEKILSSPGKEGQEHDYQLIAKLLASSDNPQLALEQMAQLLAPYEDDPEALYTHAQLAFELEQYEKADTVLQRMLKQHPEHTDALLLHSRVLHALGRKLEALKKLEQVLEQDPDNDQIRLTYARMLVDARQLKRAREEFRLLHRRLPENPDVIYALGLLAMEAGDVDDAEPHFLNLVRYNEHSAESRFALGQIAQLRNRPQDAVEWYQSVPKGERYFEAQMLAAKILADEKGVDAALDYLRQLPLESEEDRAHLAMAEAELLVSKERHEEAMTIYNEALESFPDNAQLLYGRALLAEKVNRLDLLERDLKRIIENDPKDAHALNALGYTLADRTERYEEALNYIKRAHELEPDSPAILDSMGWALYRLGRLEEALGYLRRAAKMLPSDPEVAAHLGEVLWVSGQKQEAHEVWNRALELEPDHKVLKQTLERFNP